MFGRKTIKKEEMGRVYLDWASAAPIKKAAQEAFHDSLHIYGNPSSPHSEGQAAKVLLEESRTSIARLAGVKSSSVIFTSGATEANALAIGGRIKKCAQEGAKYADMHVLYLPTMHSSVTKAIRELEMLGVNCEPLPLKNNALDLEGIQKLIRPQTVLICIDAVCGETGIRFDTLRVRRIIDKNQDAKKVLLLVDASQLPLTESIEHTRLGADLLTLDAQKVGGLRGVGALITTRIDFLAPITQGGGQESGLRPGTEPVGLIAAFASALSESAREAPSFLKKASESRSELLKLLQEIPDMMVTEGKLQSPHILNLSFLDLDTDYTVMLLDRQGYAVSTRSACETDSEEGSKTIFLLTGDKSRAASTLRISWGPTTAQSELDIFAKELLRTINLLRMHT